MKKYFYIAGAVFLALIVIMTIPKYMAGGVVDESNLISSDIEKIEVIHFHGTNQCSSCITVGDFAEETINTYFKDELESGIVSFEHINGQLNENLEKVKLYGSAGSSLWIGVYYVDGSFEKEQNMNVWYKIKDKEDYMNYLKGVIDEKLKS